MAGPAGLERGRVTPTGPPTTVQDPPTLSLFLRTPSPRAATGPEGIYWALVAQWRRQGRQVPEGAGMSGGAEPDRGR